MFQPFDAEIYHRPVGRAQDNHFAGFPADAHHASGIHPLPQVFGAHLEQVRTRQVREIYVGRVRLLDQHQVEHVLRGTARAGDGRGAGQFHLVPLIAADVPHDNRPSASVSDVHDGLIVGDVLDHQELQSGAHATRKRPKRYRVYYLKQRRSFLFVFIT